MKLAIFGGGSSYTPELLQGIIDEHDSLPISEVCLIDISAERLTTLRGLCERMIAHVGLDIAITATTDRRRGLDDASFVNGLVRVGGMAARIQDERIPPKYGIVGQETTGPGGMMKALRTIPVMLDLAQDMVAVCPNAWLINYTNPSGIIAEALGRYSKVRYIGLCSGPEGWTNQVLAKMGVSPTRAHVDWLGLNHLGYITRVVVDGHDATSEAIEAVADTWGIAPEWLRTLGAIPASYLGYYYHHEKQVAAQRAPGYQTRGEKVHEIETALLREYTDPELNEKPALLKKRGGGGYAAVAMKAMKAIHHNTGERQVVQVLNQGALDGIPADASVEISCVINNAGAHPLRLGEIPLPIRGLIQAVKAYESLTVQAAVEGSTRLAMQALMAHPLTPSWETARPLLDELLTANRRWLAWA